MAMTARLKLIEGGQSKLKRVRQPKDYRAWLKAKGVKIHKIERTPKQAGEYEFDHNGKLVEVSRG